MRTPASCLQRAGLGAFLSPRFFCYATIVVSVKKRCAMCPTVFEAKRASAKYCSPRCRMRANRAGLSAPVRAVVPAGDGGGVEAATVTELDAVDRTGSAAGQCALTLARRIDGGRDSGAGLASLVREFRSALAAAVGDDDLGPSPLDVLRERRTRRLVEELFDYDGDAG